MQRPKFPLVTVFTLFFISLPFNLSNAWDDETHIAIAKAAGYQKWYNATGADMTKIKAGEIEAHNHGVHNPPGKIVTPDMVLGQVEKYNKIEKDGHLYGATIASMRDYIKKRQRGKYGEYHLAFCSHYIGDLSQPLHNTLYNPFARKYHKKLDGIIDNEVLNNLQKIKIYPIIIHSEKDLAREIARIANISIKLGYKIGAENRPLSKEEAYRQISHSASLFKGILKFVGKISCNKKMDRPKS